MKDFEEGISFAFKHEERRNCIVNEKNKFQGFPSSISQTTVEDQTLWCKVLSLKKQKMQNYIEKSLKTCSSSMWSLGVISIQYYPGTQLYIRHHEQDTAKGNRLKNSRHQTQKEQNLYMFMLQLTFLG